MMGKERRDSQQLRLDFDANVCPQSEHNEVARPTGGTVIHQRIWGANRMIDDSARSGHGTVDPNSDEITRLIRAKAKMLGW
ncbi:MULTISPECIES: hypothetical protein [Burkholderia cepacia complex]|uniref:hypothetical protein n=1 Tax=Burkholderia cepacia complex TaxID=87882 RepID=UPI000BA615F1|nr:MULTISPECIES: hypothetical protein [Burkholderia cepacia complex]PAK14867.1 hypothetical protein CJO66_10555 [Burkholderia ubonensis]RQP31056.1 hypothetical protein DF155_21470 [Burkholderia ubonensis]RQP33936.1 hypothetical protein DF154_25110 [Burkholderia ubonensis]RQP36762.1 hypothetical protein DF156_22310 [Burkholderia ubonensis]RQP51333.1 hypothetical protein DF144_20910 [Burkholderia ubonensis]